MQYTLGLMNRYGYSVEGSVEPGVSQDKLLDYLFAKSYDGLEEREKMILHVMPLFAEPASTEAVGIASAVFGVLLGVSLGKLYQLFILDKIRLDQDRYELPLLARSYLESIRRRDSFLEIKGKSIAEFLGEAYDNLAQYYASHLGEMKSLSEKLAFLKYDKRNVTSVMEWCYSNKQLDHVIALMHQIGHPLDILGYWDERIEWGMKARQAASELDRPPESAWFEVYDIGWTYFLMGRMEEAKKITEIRYDLAQGKDGFERVEALAIGNLGRMAHEARDYKLALDKLEKSLALWQEIGDREWIAYAKARLGRLKEKTGALDEAREILKQTLKLRSEIGHVGEVAETLSELALVEFGLGDEEEALRLSDSSLIRARLEIEHPSPFYAFALYCRAVLEGRRGNPLEAGKRGREALTLYKNLGYKSMVNHVSSFLERLESKGSLPSGS